MCRLRLRFLVIFLSLPFLAGLRAVGQYDPAKIMNAWQTRQIGLTLAASHRGEVNGNYGNNMPENSIGGFQNAVDAGIEIVEMDVYTTQDHVPYLMHDKTLVRMLQMNINSYYDPNTPGVYWSDIQGKTLCGGRGVTDPAAGGSLQCTSSDTPQTVPSLVDMTNAVRLAQNQQGQPWGGVLVLDCRDKDGLVQAWSTLVQLGFLSQQVVFKFSPLNLGLFSPQDLANLLSTSTFYNNNATQAAADMQLYMNLQPYYAANTAINQEQASGDANWAINDWNNNWLGNAGSFHRLLSPEVDVKGNPGEFTTADMLYQSATNGPLNTIGVYSTYFDCNLSTGNQNLPNLPPGAAGLNGYWTTGGKCVTLNPSQAESEDGIDHRYDFNFITGQTSSNTPNITNPPKFGMILADTAGVLINYLTGYGLRSNLRSIQPPCNSSSAYPGCDQNNQTTYTLCAHEGGTCTFTGDRNVAFGANGNYNTLTITNSTACDNATFGPPDPAPGVVKACYYSPPISYRSGIYCADQGQYCHYNIDAAAILAANQQYYERLNSIGNGFQCNPASFGWFSDPIPGFIKACFYRPGPHGYVGPSGYTYCAPENGQCQFQGLGRVAFGVNGEFNYGVFNGGTACNDGVFGDPAVGSTKNCWYQVTTAASGATGTSVGNPPSGSGSGTSTCDIYASGGTPCVAAHSTVRALFGAYSGRLYQVQRASDGSMSDIGTLGTGGYANAAAQDSFCGSTTCTITMIYDQTSQHNDLTIEGPGGTVHTADSGASANALPISVNGNKVYGVKVTPGVGYRNNATSGVATGASPEGMYMVTSGTYVNSGCCFDYGNAETNAADNGEGHMDALNFGTWCGFTCNGPGPWVEADLENGQYMGNGTNLGDVSMGFDFVTAMLKNDGQATFALKGGNAQSGGLTAEYSGSLPTTKPGYIPMKLEGAIVLGTGGDNSDSGQGSFFEGAMTSGYPTDATEDAVQANIVAAGYSGDSSGGSGGSGTSEPSGPYTGPNDPNGAGPQDGFASSAAEQPNDIMGTKPALASFNGSLYAAFQANDSTHALFVTSSPTGTNFPSATPSENIKIGSAPTMTEFKHQLFLAFQADDPNHHLFVTPSSDGQTWPTATYAPNVHIGSAPAMTVFNSQLFVAFQADDANHHLFIASSSDGQTWPAATYVPNVQIGSAPAVAVFNSRLYVAFRADDASNNVFIASSPDGVNFTSQFLGQTMGGSSAPALVVSNNILYYIYGANDSDNEMLVMASTDGSTWQGPAAYLGVQMGAAGPGAAAFGNGISVGFQSNDSRNVLFVTNKATEANVYTGPNDPGGPGPQDAFASPATEQPNDVLGTKPALASFNGSLYVAFQANDPSDQLFVTSSSTGTNLPHATPFGSVVPGSAPAMAAFNNQLFIAFQANDASDQLFVTSSSTGTNFPHATPHSNLLLGSAPAMAVFNNNLFLAFQANDPNHHLFITSSSDGQTWPNGTYIPNVQIGSQPAMAVFNNKLYVAFRADDPSNNAFISSSSDGVTFTSQYLGQTMGGSSAPALAVSNCTLYYIYGANDQSNEMLVMASTDGSTWQGPAAYLGVQMGAAGPGATAFGNGVTVGFQSNDARDVLYTTSGVGGLGGNPASCK